MNLKKFFKLTKDKLIVSIIVPIIYWLFLSTRFTCKPCGEIKYESWPKIVSSCNCISGATFQIFIKDIFVVFVIPFLITYFIYSVISYLRNSK